MGRTAKRVKPAFAINASARAKALGWNGQRLAKEARLPHPTVRDVLAGISPGLEETKLAIAKALGCSLSDLYQEPTSTQAPQTVPFPSRKFFEAVIEDPKSARLSDAQRLFQQLEVLDLEKRAFLIAFAFGNFEIARPYLPDDAASKLQTLLKAL